MSAYMIVLLESFIVNDLSLFGGGEPFRIEYLMTNGSVESLVISIFPRRACVDLDRI